MSVDVVKTMAIYVTVITRKINVIIIINVATLITNYHNSSQYNWLKARSQISTIQEFF